MSDDGELDFNTVKTEILTEVDSAFTYLTERDALKLCASIGQKVWTKIEEKEAGTKDIYKNLIKKNGYSLEKIIRESHKYEIQGVGPRAIIIEKNQNALNQSKASNDPSPAKPVHDGASGNSGKDNFVSPHQFYKTVWTAFFILIPSGKKRFLQTSPEFKFSDDYAVAPDNNWYEIDRSFTPELPFTGTSRKEATYKNILKWCEQNSISFKKFVINEKPITITDEQKLYLMQKLVEKSKMSNGGDKIPIWIIEAIVGK
jgi:hypothetical protein